MTHTAEQVVSGWFTRERLLTLLLIAATLLIIYVCYRIAEPFLPALAWALALAVVTHPINDFCQRRMTHRGIAAGLAAVLVVICILGPIVLVGQQIYVQVADGVKNLQAEAASGRWRAAIERNPRLAPVLEWVETRVNLPAEADKMVRGAASRASSFLTSTIWAITQLLITVLTLFYFFRDQRSVLRVLRGLLPLSVKEADRVFGRIRDTIFATVFGSLTVSAVQGGLGGLMFWWLGLPAPVLWGLVMAVVSVIPMLGAFVVWAPAALFLLIEGSPGKALILAAWGMMAIGLIDNLLYPMLVGHRIAIHPLPVFFSIFGGILLFGPAGIILGPLSLALLQALAEVWRKRTAEGHPAEEALNTH